MPVGNDSLDELSAPELRRASGVSVEWNPSIASLEFPSLRSSSFQVRNMMGLERLSMESLEMTSRFTISSAPHLETLLLPELEQVGEQLWVWAAGIRAFEAPRLRTGVAL